MKNMKRAHIYAALACLCVFLGNMIGGEKPKIVVDSSRNRQAKSLVLGAIKAEESSIFLAAYISYQPGAVFQTADFFLLADGTLHAGDRAFLCLLKIHFFPLVQAQL